MCPIRITFRIRISRTNVHWNNLFAHFFHHCKNMKVSMNAITRSSTCFLRQRERGEVSVWKSMLHCILFNIFTCQFHSSAFVHFNCWSCQQLHSRSSQIIGWDEAWVQGGHSKHHNTEWTVPYPTHHLNWKMSQNKMNMDQLEHRNDMSRCITDIVWNSRHIQYIGCIRAPDMTMHMVALDAII